MKLCPILLSFLGVASAQETLDYCNAISCQGLYSICTEECVNKVDEDFLDACAAACEGVFDKCLEACPDNDEVEDNNRKDGQRHVRLFGEKKNHQKVIGSKEDNDRCKGLYVWCPAMQTCVSELDGCPIMLDPLAVDDQDRRLRGFTATTASAKRRANLRV